MMAHIFAVFSCTLCSMVTEERMRRYANGRPMVEYPSNMNESAPHSEFVDTVVQCIVKSRVSANLFRFDETIVRVQRTDTAVVARALNNEDRDALIKQAVYLHKGESDGYAAVTYVPAWLRGLVMRELLSHLRPYVGVVGHPIVTPSGRIVVTNGYNDETGLFVDTNLTDASLSIPQTPTADDLAVARKHIASAYRHRVFRSQWDEARYVAVLLTAVCQPCFDTVPLVYSNGYSVDDASNVVLKEITRVLHDSRVPSYYKRLDMQSGDASALSAPQNTVLPVLLGWSAGVQNTMPQWPCSIRTSVLKNVAFYEYRSDVLQKLVADFRTFRVNVLRSVLILVRAWQQAGKPSPTAPSAFDSSLDEWYEYVAGILDYTGYMNITPGVKKVQPTAQAVQ